MTCAMRFLIVEDHPLFQQALRALLRQTMPESEVLVAASIDEAIELLQQDGRVTLALLDLHLPSTRDFSGLLKLRKKFPRVPFAVVSSLDDPDIVREAIGFGAMGFIPKSFVKDDFKRIISGILAGDIYVPPGLIDAKPCEARTKREQICRGLQSLTRRQLTVLQKIREGKPNREIAADLGVRETTVKAHVSDILQKLNAFSRTQLVAISKSLEFDQIASDRI